MIHFNFEIAAQVILVFINAIGTILAWWVVRSGSNSQLKKWFFIMTVFILLWANFSYLGSRSEMKDLSIMLYRMNWASVALFLPSFYYFYVIYYLQKKGVAEKLGLLIIIISFVLSIISLFSHYIISGVTAQSWGMEIIFGPLGDTFSIYSAFVAFIVVFYSLQGYRKLRTEERKKLNYFLAGVFIFISANLIFNVGSQILFQSVQYQILGDFSSIFLLGFTAYATIQHRLFNVKTIASEAITAVLLAVLLSRIFVSQDYSSRLIDILIFVIALVFGYLLIKSVDREVQQREQLQKLTFQLKELDKKKDEFINVAAHELRAPMTGIKGYLSMLQDGDAGDLGSQAHEFLRDAILENDRLIRLVNNMLNVSRIEEGRMVFDMGEVSMVDVTRVVFNEFKSQAKQKMLAYGMQVDDGVADKVYVDRDRIHEVVANLISNAVKYTDSGSVSIKISNTGANFVRVEVIDSGPGMTQEEVNNLFQKFYRTKSSIGKTMGTGLGLFISKLLVERFGGTIGVQSKKGKGSIFWFELPVRK